MVVFVIFNIDVIFVSIGVGEYNSGSVGFRYKLLDFFLIVVIKDVFVVSIIFNGLCLKCRIGGNEVREFDIVRFLIYCKCIISIVMVRVVIGVL